MVCVNPHDLSSEATARECRNSRPGAGQEMMGDAGSHVWAEKTRPLWAESSPAATRGRWYGSGMSLPINGKDIETGRLSQNKMISPHIKSCTGAWEMQSKRRTKLRKDRGRKSKWSWLNCYLAKQLGSSLKFSEDSKDQKGSDVGSLDLGPLLEKLK